jgi:hypothetical protein
MHNADSLWFEIGQLWIKPSSGQTDKAGPISHSELNINHSNVQNYWVFGLSPSSGILENTTFR